MVAKKDFHPVAPCTRVPSQLRRQWAVEHVISFAQLTLGRLTTPALVNGITFSITISLTITILGCPYSRNEVTWTSLVRIDMWWWVN